MRTIAVLSALCCVAVASWAGDGRSPVPGTQEIVSLPPMPKFDVAQLFEAADVNHDQRVTFQEAHNYNFLVTQEQFNLYDTDHNGYVDRTEAGLPPVDLNIAQIFKAADTNNDQRVTFDELYAADNLVTQAQFDTYDTNLDGVIDREEAGLAPVSTGCSGCTGSESLPTAGDLFTMALSLLGVAAMAKVGRP